MRESSEKKTKINWPTHQNVTSNVTSKCHIKMSHQNVTSKRQSSASAAFESEKKEKIYVKELS